MGFQRVVINLEVFNEGGYRPVRLFVEQVVQALVVIRADYFRRFGAVASPKQPTYTNSPDDQCVKYEVIHNRLLCFRWDL